MLYFVILVSAVLVPRGLAVCMVLASVYVILLFASWFYCPSLMSGTCIAPVGPRGQATPRGGWVVLTDVAHRGDLNPQGAARQIFQIQKHLQFFFTRPKGLGKQVRPASSLSRSLFFLPFFYWWKVSGGQRQGRKFGDEKNPPVAKRRKRLLFLRGNLNQRGGSDESLVAGKCTGEELVIDSRKIPQARRIRITAYKGLQNPFFVYSRFLK